MHMYSSVLVSYRLCLSDPSKHLDNTKLSTYVLCLQVVEPPDLTYFRFVIVIISVLFCFCISMLSLLLPVFLFCSGYFSFNQSFFEDVTSVDCVIFLKRQFAILNSML